MLRSNGLSWSYSRFEGRRCTVRDSEDSLWSPSPTMSAQHCPVHQSTRTWRIASLCISCPWHAGTRVFNTPNSSFIFDLLLLSITECAVFRAIFLPAALVALGCFFVGTAAADWATLDPRRAALFGFGVSEVVDSSTPFDLGFIWMIFRERVGGGGREKSAAAGIDGD